MADIEWFVGFDWASEKHRACLLDGLGRVVGERDVTHGGAGLGECFDWIVEKTGATPDKIAIAIETPHGPVVEAALERGFLVFAINPKQLDRFRDRFGVAGAKDDSRDARVLGDSLRTDRHAFRPLCADDPIIVELREWSRIAEDLKGERNRLTNRMRDQLWRYYPQALKLADDLGAEWFLKLWEQIPTPTKAKTFRKAAIAKILGIHHVRRLDAEEVLQTLREKPLKVAGGTTEAATAHIQTLIARIRLVNEQIKGAHRKLDELCKKLESAGENEPGQASEQRDVTILHSLPGMGRINLATLLAEASQPLKQRDYRVLRALSGVAPVTRQSGKRKIVLRRYACNRRLEQALHHWARVAVQQDAAARRRYAALRARGHTHGRALRTVGDRLLSLACALLERQVLYDPNYQRTGACQGAQAA